MSRKSKYTETQINAYIRMRAQGRTNRAIERETGIKESTQRLWQRQGKYQNDIRERIEETKTELTTAKKVYSNNLSSSLMRINMSYKGLTPNNEGLYEILLLDGNAHGKLTVMGIITADTAKLFSALNLKFSENNTRYNVKKRRGKVDPIVVMSYSEAAELLNRPYTTPDDRANFKRFIRTHLTIMQGISFEWKWKSYKGEELEVDGYLVNEKLRCDDREQFGIIFSTVFANYEVKQGTVFQLPLGYFKTTLPTATVICGELARHYTNRANIINKTNNIVSVKAILNWVKDYIPSYERVKKYSQRHYKPKIIEPFEDAFDELKRIGVISSWNYCNSKHKKLTPEQEANRYNYSTWVDFYVEFEIPKQEAIPIGITDINQTDEINGTFL